MYSILASQDARIPRFLSHWALFGGLAELGLVVMMMAFIMPAAAGSGLADGFAELVAAAKIPIAYRAAILLDGAVWVAIGGFLLVWAILLTKGQPVRGALIAACGVAQIIGLLGAVLRLEGTTGLAGQYLAAAAGQRGPILQAYTSLQAAFNAHFDTGSLVYALGFLLLASIVWRLAGFPRWLAAAFALVGIFNLANVGVAMLSGQYQFVLFFLALLAEITSFLGTSAALRARARKVREGMELA